MSLLLENLSVSPDFNLLYEKIRTGSRLSKEDGLKLYESNDILSIAALADFARINRLKDAEQLKKIDYVYWINNHHLNITNICEGKCKFCAYRRQEGQDGAFLYPLDEAKMHIEKNISKDIKEIHIVSALNPKCDLDYYVNLLGYCKEVLPNAHIQAFTAVEIDYLSKISGTDIEKVLLELKNAGLGSLPGGGAELFSPEIRAKVCPEKISGESWLNIMKTAHGLGLKSNATMLTGIGESCEDKLDHMLALREAQDETGGFMTFIPLICYYENTEIDRQEDATGFDIIKDYAISRIMLDNFPHIKSFWIQAGIKLAQISLCAGVDDLDGTVIEEKITRFAGARTGQALSKDELINLIRKAGKIPVERDTVYNIIKVY